MQWTTLIVALILAVAAGGLLGASAIAAIHHGQTVMHDELDSLQGAAQSEASYNLWKLAGRFVSPTQARLSLNDIDCGGSKGTTTLTLK